MKRAIEQNLRNKNLEAHKSRRELENLFSKMLIGSAITVLESSVPTLIHKSGKIIDETRNVLKIASGDQKNISIPKSSCVFEVETDRRKIIVSGKELVGTPQERIHKL